MLNLLKDVFSSLQRHKVRYIVIGGIAAVLHGVPRATFDLDILIEAKPENAKNLLEAFLDARLGTAALTIPEGLLSQEITIFKDRVRIDVQTSTPGLKFEEAWERRETMEYQKQKLAWFGFWEDDLYNFLCEASSTCLPNNRNIPLFGLSYPICGYCTIKRLPKIA